MRVKIEGYVDEQVIAPSDVATWAMFAANIVDGVLTTGKTFRAHQTEIQWRHWLAS